MTTLYILPLVFVAYINLNTYLKIDIKHRKNYITFIVDIILCLLSILVIIINEINFSIFPSLITITLMIITVWQKYLMVVDLKQDKHMKQNSKKKR